MAGEPSGVPVRTETGADRFVERAGALIPAGELRALCALRTAPAVAGILFDIGVMAVAIAGAVVASHWLASILAVLVVGARQHAIAVLMHDAAHHRLFASRGWNDRIGRWLLGYPIGVSMLTYRAMHVRHHNHLYELEDPDLALYAVYPRSPGYLARKVLKDLFGLTLFKNIEYLARGRTRTHRGEGAGERPSIRSRPELEAERRKDRHGLAIFQVVLWAVMVVSGLWPWFLIYWVLPSITVVQVILRVRAIGEHGAVPDRTRRLLSARTVEAGVLTRFFLTPHQVHYHLEHHLWPAIPFYQLPRAHRLLKENGALEGVPAVTSYLEVIRRATAGEG